MVTLAGATLRSDELGLWRRVDPERPYNPVTARRISVVGMRLGDEGKGRVVPELTGLLQQATGHG